MSDPTPGQVREELLRLLLAEEGFSFSPSRITRARREGDGLSLSFAQQRLWILEQFTPGNPAYNVPVTLVISGLLNMALLEQSINEMVRRHESLRTYFPVINGRPFQSIAPHLNLSLLIVDLRDLPELQRDQMAARLAGENAKRPFDLAETPPVRTALLWLAEPEYLIILCMHHIISDRRSKEILMHEVKVIYEALAAGFISPLPELPIQYADYAIWQRRWLEDGVAGAQLLYWKKQLADAPLLQLPTERLPSSARTFGGASLQFSVSRELTDALKRLSYREGVTLFMMMLAAFQLLLFHRSGQCDIVVGTDVANRNQVDTEGLIGFFINQLALRTDLSGNPSFRELLARTREVCLKAYANQDIPFDMLAEELNQRWTGDSMPFFRVKFVFHQALSSDLRLPHLATRLVESDAGKAKFDLLFNVWERGQELSGDFEYSTDLFCGDKVSRMLEHYQVILREVTLKPEASSDLILKALAEYDNRLEVRMERLAKESGRQKLKQIRRKGIEATGRKGYNI